jgi:hypothetical protein
LRAVRARAETLLEAGPNRVFAVLADLGTWPAWLDVVVRAEPDGEAAWRVRLGLSFGPASVGYDVRMVRVPAAPVPNDPGGREHCDSLRFERDESDGRKDHSMVVIDVRLVATGAVTTATLTLEIDKRIPMLDLQRQLDRRIARATRRLQRLLDER